jgi:hypothetical protein
MIDPFSAPEMLSVPHVACMSPIGPSQPGLIDRDLRQSNAVRRRGVGRRAGIHGNGL